MANTQTTVTLLGIGGIPPYHSLVVTPPDLPFNTTFIPAGGVVSAVGNNQFILNASAVTPGLYSVHFQIIDSVSNISDSIINVRVVDPSIFTILNESQNFQPVSFPANVSIPLLSNGQSGAGAVTWSLIQSATTLPGITIDASNNLDFSLTGYGSWTVGIQATDSLGDVTSKVLLFQVPSSAAFQMVDGQVEINVTPTALQTGTHTFTLGVTDSANNVATQQFTYQAQAAISQIELVEAYFNHYWDAGDTTSLVFPISGELSGFSLGSAGPITLSNGLVVTIDNINDVVKVSGPPGPTFRNSEVRIPIVVQQGSQQVGVISREYSLLCHNDAVNPGDLGTLSSYPRPYIVGQFVGLNPQKPYFNSPNIFTSSNYVVQVASGSSLPPGLSLDTNTGLIYGNLIGPATSPSVLNYVDSFNIVHGTVTVNWTTLVNNFLLIDNIPSGEIGAAFSGAGAMVSTSQVPLSSVSVYSGVLPAGLTAAIDVSGLSVDLVGTPTEAGYFDIWFNVVNQNGQNSYLYHRLVVDYINPLVITTSTLSNIVTGQAYSQLLSGYGGTPPYTWTLDSSSPVLPGGITLSSSGLLAGTTSATTYTANVIIDLTDSRGASTSGTFALAINNTLTIITPNLPPIPPGQNYSVGMQAQGGVPPYTWAISPNSGPTGISFNTTNNTPVNGLPAGSFSGVTSENSFSETVTIVVTDSASNTAQKVYTLATGSNTGMLIDTSGVGPINRGAPYQGTLQVTGLFTAPVSWQVTPDSNPLPVGLTLQANSSNNGVTAAISGVYSGILTNYSVKILATDSAANSTLAVLLLSTDSSLQIVTTSLPQGTVGAPYSTTLAVSGVNPPFNWNLDSHSPPLPAGYVLTSTGVIQGTASNSYSQNIIVDVSDSLSPADSTSATLNLVVQNSTLAVTTPSIPAVISGRAYSVTLAATGGVPPYSWGVSPNSQNQLPTGIVISSTGVISGNTSLTGFSKAVLFRVTDSIGAYVDASFTVTVNAGLVLHSGPDYVDGISTGCLGYVVNGNVSSINPRPNYSFYIIATGVVSTSPSQIQVSIGNPQITYSVTQLNTTTGIAYISLSGTFSAGEIGVNDLSVSVTDSGVNVSSTFNWQVIQDNALNLTPSSGTFPTQVVNT
jgi:Putative Ig domain